MADIPTARTRASGRTRRRLAAVALAACGYTLGAAVWSYRATMHLIRQRSLPDVLFHFRAHPTRARSRS